VADHAVLPADREAGAGGTDAAADEDLRSLRTILVGPAEQQLQRLQARLDDRFSNARDLGTVLPQALRACAGDPELARALRPPVEEAITASVRRDPRPLADAIFPIIGPAIRRAVAASLASMLDSFNRTLEHRVSWRALRWRWEAFRTGRPFGEVVLLHTLLYRVEQVFLIHRETGLLLQHVRAGVVRVEDAQLVSAMLTAIRDFVRDSFRVAEDESLDALQVGDLSVWVEQGPLAIAAMVTRGTAPRELRVSLQRALEAIHLQHGAALEAFSGDTAPFDGTRPVLEECLQAEYRAGSRGRAGRAWMAVAAIALVVAAAWAAVAVRDRMRWSGYVDALAREPGLVVISTGRSEGRYVVAGLRDPFARDPADLLAGTRLSPDDVAGRWEPYHALTPPFVLARARQILQPPQGVTLGLENGVLAAEGLAPAAWVADAGRLAPLVPGVSAFDANAVVASGLEQVTERIEALTLMFVRGSSQLLPGQDETLRTLADAIVELDALAAVAGRRLRLEIIGNTDADGPAASNLPLSRARAARVRAALELPPTPWLDIVTDGVGSEQPLVAGDTETDKQRNRRAVVRVSDPSRSTGLTR
jgi:outer membrane protein OmpA-like peptidoglycan-associated protein